jgi:hypothetical protein
VVSPGAGSVLKQKIFQGKTIPPPKIEIPATTDIRTSADVPIVTALSSALRASKDPLESNSGFIVSLMRCRNGTSCEVDGPSTREGTTR